MKSKPFYNFFVIVTMVGVIAFVSMYIFGTKTFITEYQAGTITLYKFDVANYFLNINDYLSNFATEMALKMPTKQWRNLEGLDWYKDLANDLAVMLNYVILAMNITFYPFRFMGYVLNLLIKIVGIDLKGSAMNWLYMVLTTLSNLQIPYIN